jgi:hypothetical protein
LNIPLEDFSKLLRFCTCNVQFLFNGTFYRQIDGVAMGSPLGPVLADIFMSHSERLLQQHIETMAFYKRYVDDIFAICDNPSHVESILCAFNQVHSNLTFTCETELNDCLPFLDVLLHRRADGTLPRRTFRKATWCGQYLHFRSFAPIRYKRGLVISLFKRARQIATEEFVEDDLNLLRQTFMENGYPSRFIDKYCQPREPRPVLYSAPKLNVYLSLPFKGDNVSILIKGRLQAALQRTYNAANLVYIEETTRVPSTPRKDPVPLLAKSNVIYQFQCTCGCRYVGKTKRHLGTRVSEHLLRWLLYGSVGVARSDVTSHSKQIAHRVDPQLAFKVIYSPRWGHTLDVAEALAIRRLNPALCTQKQMLTTPLLPW